MSIGSGCDGVDTKHQTEPWENDTTFRHRNPTEDVKECGKKVCRYFYWVLIPQGRITGADFRCNSIIRATWEKLHEHLQQSYTGDFAGFLRVATLA